MLPHKKDAVIKGPDAREAMKAVDETGQPLGVASEGQQPDEICVIDQVLLGKWPPKN
jgi:hypothetical protein